MIKEVIIEKPDDINFIFGQSHFIKTVEDIYEVMANIPGSKFGIAFCEASADCLIRFDGNDDDMVTLAVQNAENIACGHSFIIFMKDCFPINVLNQLKQVTEICSIFCATANPTKILIYETENANSEGRAIVGIVDGFKSKGVEDDSDKIQRKKFLRDIGYKK